MKNFSININENPLETEKENKNSISTGSFAPKPSHKLTVDEVLGSNNTSTKLYDGKSALDALKKRMQKVTEEATIDTQESVPEQPKEPEAKTLLEKCKPYIMDENGKNASIPTSPLYKLESVAEILKNNSQDTLSRLAQKYDITVDYLGKYVEEQSNQSDEPSDIQNEALESQEIQINAVFENVQSSMTFAVTEVEDSIESLPQDEQDFSNTATITFTPINEAGSEKPKIIISNNTREIDLTGEIAPIEDVFSKENREPVTLEKDEFEDFVPQDEIKNENDLKKFIRMFSISKRKNFLSVSFSVILTLFLIFMELPFMSDIILGETKITMIICTAIAGLITLLNIDMFISFSNIFSKKSVADICPSIASITVLAYAIMGILTNEIVLDILLLLAIILTCRALGKFRKNSYMLSNLKVIAGNSPKNAVKLINDKAVTFAMAKNSIEGDALVAVSQKCNKINDFIKYSSFGVFLNGKLPIITVISIILSIISGLAAANYFNGAVYGLYAAAVIQCFASLPCLFFVKDFPLYAAAKKLNKSGSMIAGQMAAKHIEMANALVLNSSDIFPSGTVTLKQMKVLSQNDLDRTILRAASLTECLNSPLAPIFKGIAGQSNITSLPDSDTVKYEERMGISGWVDDELLFIGNRTIMEAHGITVPDVEIDRKILRGGYFPVYVASSDKVCALLIIQYSVDPVVSHELRRLAKMGVTLIVNNTDPNITDQMICDYIGLYDDSVMIMTNAGYHMYKNSVTPKESCSCPACFKHGGLAIAKIMNCANRIKRSNNLLTVMYIISAILGIIIFAYSSFAGSGTLINSATVLLYSLICTAVSYILYLFYKP